MIRMARTIVLVLAAMLTMTFALQAAEIKAPVEPKKPQYKKVTGSVVSVSPTSIVIKSRVKGDMTIAVTPDTDIVNGKAAKQGDRACVNYRVDKTGKTATRIEVLASNAAVQTQSGPKTSK